MAMLNEGDFNRALRIAGHPKKEEGRWEMKNVLLTDEGDFVKTFIEYMKDSRDKEVIVGCIHHIGYDLFVDYKER